MDGYVKSCLAALFKKKNNEKVGTIFISHHLLLLSTPLLSSIQTKIPMIIPILFR
jgi:hypothetical protein